MQNVIAVSWDELKNFVQNKPIDLQYVVVGSVYIVNATERSFVVQAIIPIENPRNAEQADFEDNFKSAANYDYSQIAKTVTDTVNSQLMYEGFSLDPLAAFSEPKWRIKRTLIQGNIKTEEIVNIKCFDQIWNNRTSLFSPPILNNGASLLFNGIDEHVDLGDNYIFGPAQAFSWSFWFKADNFASQRAFIAKTSQDVNVYGYSIQHNDSGQIFLQVRALLALNNHTCTTVMSPGTWYHVCVTYAGGSNMNGFTVYINAAPEPIPSSSTVGDFTSVTDPLLFGSRGGTFHYSGNMNQISVWNKALSQAEVTEIYNNGSPANLNSHSAVANLLSWWYLNTDANFPTEVDAHDSVNGTLINMDESNYDPLDVP